ncbi:leucine-rich repeat-containing protein 4-like [Chelonus insularis]|uniref:leucine-rich repeat-containing protein 4-like n=1 Tax=Chelonus insularis TaxID=460826 RepID=UPI00158D6599|nr:leucine-rich repeat-containing protein 4-like [Chelonus insularis]
MYHGAQISARLLLWLIGLRVAWWAVSAEDAFNITSSAETLQCLHQCICLSSKQVLCNTGGLKEIPTTLNAGVEDLSLSKNDFSVIESDAFKSLRSLRKLSLDYNNISVIKPFAFRGLTMLTDLSIQYTPLSYIGQYSFAMLHNVTLILLAHNKIEYIEEYSFAGTSYIKWILLSDNPLVTIHSRAFSGLNNVERLIFPSGIRKIEPDAFNSLSNVGFLKFTFMDLSNLLPFTFRGLSHVQVLNIQESDLGVIKPDAFNGSEHIDNLNLLNNKIDAIQELKFTPENAIGVVRFHGNHVLRSPRAKDTSLRIHSISAENNFFPCDCQIHELFDSDFTNGSVHEFRRKNYCISPLEYNGHVMSSIDFDLIAKCHDKVVQDNLGSSAASSMRNFLILVLSIFYIIQ